MSGKSTAAASPSVKAPTVAGEKAKPARAPRTSSRARLDDPDAPAMIMRAWPHVREMMARRGYDASSGMSADIGKAKAAKTPIYRVLQPQDQETIDATLREARASGAKRARVDRPQGPILLVFTAVPKINVDIVRAAVERMGRGDGTGPIPRAMLLSCKGYTSQVPGEIAKLLRPGWRVELATYGQHFFCPVDHRSVPPHDILSQAQKAQLLARLGLTDDTRLPRQLMKDTLSRYYGLEPGAVVHYRRSMGTLEMVHYYRVVVASD